MLILERPWTRQPQHAADIRSEHRGKIIALWNTASPGGIVYDAAGGYHAPGQGRLQPTDRGIAWNGARSNYTTTTRALPALAAGTPVLLATWFRADSANRTTDALVKVGAFQGGAVPYKASLNMYCNVSQVATDGGIYIGTYGCDFKSSAGGHVVANAWTHIAILYDGGAINAGSVTLTTPWTLFINNNSVGLTAEGSAQTGTSNFLQIWSNAATLADDTQTTLSARGKLGSTLFATGGVAYLRKLAAQHYENPYALLAPRRIYIPTAAAAAGAPTITALSAIGITATSAQPRISYS